MSSPAKSTRRSAQAGSNKKRRLFDSDDEVSDSGSTIIVDTDGTSESKPGFPPKKTYPLAWVGLVCIFRAGYDVEENTRLFKRFQKDGKAPAAHSRAVSAAEKDIMVIYEAGTWRTGVGENDKASERLAFWSDQGIELLDLFTATFLEKIGVINKVQRKTINQSDKYYRERTGELVCKNCRARTAQGEADVRCMSKAYNSQCSNCAMSGSCDLPKRTAGRLAELMTATFMGARGFNEILSELASYNVEEDLIRRYKQKVSAAVKESFQMLEICHGGAMEFYEDRMARQTTPPLTELEEVAFRPGQDHAQRARKLAKTAEDKVEEAIKLREQMFEQRVEFLTMQNQQLQQRLQFQQQQQQQQQQHLPHPMMYSMNGMGFGAGGSGSQAMSGGPGLPHQYHIAAAIQPGPGQGAPFHATVNLHRPGSMLGPGPGSSSSSSSLTPAVEPAVVEAGSSSGGPGGGLAGGPPSQP